MAKIDNTIVYPIKTNVSSRDRVIITDVEDNNATKSANIGDITGSINILEQQIVIPSSDLYSINTIAYSLIPGVADHFICPISIIAQLNFVSTVYNFNPSDKIHITTASAGYNGCAHIFGGTLNNSANNVTIGTGEGLANGGFIPGENLVLWGAGSVTPPTTGDSTLTINIMYRLVKL
tara:strand:- start:805 stop:1338 length:534 start_codon:yes stop_codon:yes gene_type:complete